MYGVGMSHIYAIDLELCVIFYYLGVKQNLW